MKVLKRVDGKLGQYDTIFESTSVQIEISDGVMLNISESHKGYVEILKSDYNNSSRLEIIPQSGNVILMR